MLKILAAIPALTLGVTAAALLMAQAPAKGPAFAPVAPKAVPFSPRKADEFVVHTPGGADKLLSSYQGKVVVLAFMYTTCSHCQHTAGVLAKIQTAYAGKDVQILGVTFDPDAKTAVASFIKMFGVNFPCGWSTPDQVKKFLHIGPNVDYFVPMLAFLDRNGTIRSQYIVTDVDSAAEGFLDEQETTIPKEIDKLLKIPPAAVTTAKQAPKS